MRIKDNTVNISGLKVQTWVAMLLVDSELWRRGWGELTVTSANDGKHMVGSKHYTGDAFDARTFDLSPHIAPEAVREHLAKLLGPDYDVVLESDHIHIEYDPS